METSSLLQNKKLIQVGISALLALMFVNFYLKQKEQNIEDTYGMVEVLAAMRDIPPRTLINPSYLTVQRVPRKFMQPGAILVKIPLQAFDRIRGKITIASIPEGAQISQSNLIEPNSKEGGVAPMIPPGKRAFLLRLGNTDVADLILPGDHIDVMATFTVRRNEGATKNTSTILQNILVLSVGKTIKRPNEGATTKKEATEGLVVTLAVAPVEAERLALAQSESQGEITITVRPQGEEDLKTVPGATPHRLVTGR